VSGRKSERGREREIERERERERKRRGGDDSNANEGGRDGTRGCSYMPTYYQTATDKVLIVVNASVAASE